MRIGEEFGTTPFGTHQIEAHRDHEAGCTCDPRLVELDYSDVRCPVHGLEAHLRALVARLKTEAAG